ncbi:uncharacterized protein LOC131223234 isoform X2 [Magnolia sinica]|uniref:uncharacterized protein LOC131223234 isoform X2 n=1 Tax=Magnolia sinica TaxID=86752 RepID=UPI00265914A2|nr:uncharacterized protein LOC131223234 isoform X2 [Magnolia sinica]
MKEPSHPSRYKKQPSAQKLKVLCSFNGAFRHSPPSGKLRYVGGETRIISIDRGVRISRLLSKISELCPKYPSISLKYQLPEPGCGRDRDVPPLMSILSDEDLRYMIEEHDRMASGGKNVRLRVFVICDDNGYVGPNLCSFSFNVFNADSGSLLRDNAFKNNISMTHVDRNRNLVNRCGLNGSQPKIETTHVVGIPSSEDSFCQTAYRPQISMTHMAGIKTSGEFLASDASPSKITSAHVARNQNSDDSFRQAAFRPQILITHMSGIQNFADSCIKNPSGPQNPMTCMTGIQNFGSMHPLPEFQLEPSSSRLSEGLVPEGRTAKFPNQIYNSKKLGHAQVENLNRDNSMLWNVGRGQIGTCLAPVSCTGQLGRKVSPFKFLVRTDGILSNPQCRVRNHRIGAGNIRHYQIGLYDVRGHRHGPHDAGNQRVNCLDSKPCYGKCNVGLRPRSDILKVGQIRSFHARTVKAWYGVHEHDMEGFRRMADTSKGTPLLFNNENGRGILREWAGQLTDGRCLVDRFCVPGSLQETEFGNLDFHGHRGLHHGFVGPKSSSCHKGLCACSPHVENLVPCVGAMTIKEDLQCNQNLARHETESQPMCGNPLSISHQFSEACESSFHHPASNGPHCHDLNREPGLNIISKGGNIDAAVMNPYLPINLQQNAIKIPTFSIDVGHNTGSESVNGIISPLYNQNIQAGHVCETPEAVIMELSNDCYGHNDKLSLDLSVHNLSSLSLTKVAAPMHGSSLAPSDDLESNGGTRMYGQKATNDTDISGCHDALRGHEMGTQSKQLDLMDSSPLVENLTEVGTHIREDYYLTGPSDGSFKDVPELGLSQKLSGQSYPAAVHMSCSAVKDLSCSKENEQKGLSNSGMEEKVHGKGSGCCSEVVVEDSSDFAKIYTHLATQELQTIQNSDLEEIRVLGSGTYGTVSYGKWKGSDVAIKRIKPSCFDGGEVGDDRLVADFWKEAHLLGQLHHPNVLAFYGVVKDGPVTNLATVTEYMVNGSLKQVLQRKDRTIDRRKRLIIAMDAAFGMEYLHEKNVVHFDLKSHNFLVNMRDPQRPVCKVKRKTLVSGGVRGTIPWMAPELLTADKSSMVTEKVDVYSFGIVMWELLTGEEPYGDMRSEEIIAGIIKGDLRPEIPSWCDPTWRSLMERCWSSDPNLRPSFSEIAKELRAMSASMNIK